jgi:hypothetical protein
MAASRAGRWEKFFLPKDQAYNFARDVTRKAQKYWRRRRLESQIGSPHKHYDLMFEDIRKS